MSEDIEWITMMDYQVDGRGGQKVLGATVLTRCRK